MSAVIRLQTFDSGLIADKVGQVDCYKSGPMPSVQERQAINQEALEQAFDLVYVALPNATSEPGWMSVGNLQRFTGALEPMISMLARYTKPTELKEIEPSDWPAIRAFMSANFAPTRFHRDSNIQPSKALQHKMKIFEFYVREKQGTGFLSFEQDAMTGLQFSFVEDPETVSLYEIEVATGTRNPLIALNLLGSTLQRLKETAPGLTKVKTAIYTDNDRSTRLFTKLGLAPAGSPECYYHFWPKLLNGTRSNTNEA